MYKYLLLTFGVLCSETGYSQSKPKVKGEKCLRNIYGLKKPMNQEVELQFCFEHAGRTCCHENDIIPIRSKMYEVRKLSVPPTEGICQAVTSRALCTVCDADVGTGINSDGAICLNFCDEWFLSCQSAFIDPYLDKNKNVPFCRDESLVCTQVAETFESSRQFCEFMGFQVRSPSQMEDSESFCFNGIPRQLTLHGKLMRSQE